MITRSPARSSICSTPARRLVSSSETLPTPKDPRIRFVITPPSKRAAVWFSGFAGDATIAEQTSRLEAFLTQQTLKRIGEPVIAFYDDPFTLPWNRRTEISAEVE